MNGKAKTLKSVCPDGHIDNGADDSLQNLGKETKMDFEDRIDVSEPEAYLTWSETVVDYSGIIDIEWFEPSEFITYLKPEINRYYNWATFAMSCLDGHIYFTPDLVYKCFMDMAKAKNQSEKWIDTEWYDRKMLLIYITAEMLEFGAVPQHLVSSGYHSGQFRYVYAGKPGKKVFVPFDASFFNVSLIQLEKGKSLVFRHINSIRR